MLMGVPAAIAWAWVSSIVQPIAAVAGFVAQVVPPSAVALAGKIPHAVLNVLSAVPTDFVVAAAADCEAAARADKSLGTAMAAIIRMIATTIRSSIRLNPFCRFVLFVIFPNLSF